MAKIHTIPPPSANPKKVSNSFVLYKRLFRYVFHYWPAFVLAMVGNIVYSGVDSSMTYMLKPIMNKGFIERDIHFIHFLPWLVLGAFLVRGVANITSSYFMAYVSRGVIMRFRQQIFSHLLKLPASYFDNIGTGQVLSILMYNVEQVASAGSDVLTDLAQSLCYIIGLLTVMITISWHLSFLFFIAIPVIAFTVHFSSKHMRRISSNLQKKMGEVTSIAEEAIEGYKVIRTFGGQNYEANKFYEATKRSCSRELKVNLINATSSSSVQLIAAMILSFIVYLATSHHSPAVLSAGSFVAIIAAMLAILKPLKTFTTVNSKIQRGLAGAESVFELLDKAVEPDNGSKTIHRSQGLIEYRDVTFTYASSGRTVLKNLQMTIQPGQRVAFVGRSGSGKTTMIHLLQRFYEGWQGQILLDHVEIQQYVLSDLRRQFATVSQNITLFNDTVAHNIAYGSFAKAEQEEVISAAKAAHAWEFIREMPHGFDTLIGENGIILSGGQRQRIAIARAILKNAPILILDEATASLDTESEKQVQEALDELMKYRTTLVIAHRLSTIEHADMIVVMDHGYIVEMGTHEDLLNKGGYYARLYRMQFKEG